jgi:hypothetical protein
MSSRSMIVRIAAVVLLSVVVTLAQNPPASPAPRADRTDPDVTYGRVKEFTAGQKIVVDVDNSIDKNFDLKDKDIAVKVDKALKVGDPVKITERSVAGKKTVEIVKNTDPNVKHGDSDRKK